ncbi:S-layer homology domain-containing protein [Helcobacillus massiliensis]|uniref:S-layer homology domain-containing protein n=1 Tax=Helcobacillus massiliensis TaxID=521392 RepID=UPI00255415AC|nr:S-layer homology domain-containing protein [Helcobacillus massiliensis]MDK7742598.1 S-layer homology domain-containing protein [Helcobacillus massiliensis]WOO92242.1 S-layer homology domain-containing protein [Helcobacillus massiliensis]
MSLLPRRSLIRTGAALPFGAAAVPAASAALPAADGTQGDSGTTITDEDLATPESAKNASSAADDDAPGRSVAGTATMAAATWTGEDPDTVEVSARAADGTWCPWRRLELLTDMGAKATDPSWFGPSTAVRFRAARDGQDVTAELTAHLIETSEDPSDHERVGNGPSGGGTGLTGTVPATKVLATAAPAMFTRAEWGANESWARNSSADSELKSVVVHHTAGSNSYSRADSMQIMRGIYSYHTRTLGWADVGYNVLVDKYGQIFEGRRGGIHRNIRGAHALGFNHSTFGISIMGDYEVASAPSAGIDALARVAGWKLGSAFIADVRGTSVHQPRNTDSPAVRYKSPVSLPRIFGHRDVNYTSCPGKNVYSKFENLRTLAQRYRDAHPTGHYLAFHRNGGFTRFGTVTHAQRLEGSYHVTRATRGLVVTAGQSTVAHQSPYAASWTPEWGQPLESKTSGPQRFANGIADKVNGKVVFTAGGPGQTFKDVPRSHMFSTEIEALANKGILRGWPDGTYRPSVAVNRDAIIAFMYRVAGSPAYTPPARSPFVDVPTNSQFYREISWAYATGLSTGWTTRRGREFRPLQPVNRDAIAAFLFRSSGDPLPVAKTAPFRDVPRTSQFAREITWMKSADISTGWPDGTFRPLVATNRADMAAFIYRLMKRQGKL